MNNVTFKDSQVKEMAIFTAQLLREGITFMVFRNANSWTVELKGF